MKIGSTLKTIAVLPLFLGCLISVFLVWTTHIVDQRIGRGEKAEAILHGVVELALRSYDPSLLTGDPVALADWRDRKARVDAALQEFGRSQAGLSSRVSGLGHDLDRIEAVLDTVAGGGAGTGSGDAFQGKPEEAPETSVAAAQNATANALALSTEYLAPIRDEVTKASRWTVVLVLAFSVLWSLAIFGLGRGISRPVAALMNVVKGEERDDIPNRRANELGLASSFIRHMAEDLATVTATRDDLDREMTEHRKVEDALRLSEGLFRSLIDASPSSIFLKNLDGRFEIVNSTYLEYWGITDNVAIGQKAVDHLPLEIAERFAKEEQHVLTTRRVHQFEWSLEAETGSEEIQETVLFPIFDAEGEIAGTGGISTDITFRKNAVDRLRRDEERFRSYFEMGLIGIAETSPERGWLHVNRHLCDMLGFEPTELEKRTWNDLTHPEDMSSVADELEQVFAGRSEGYVREKRFVRKDGHILDTMMSVRCQRDPDGTPSHLIVFIQDISEVKTIQRELEKANAALERSNQELQQFAYIASHDLREPLRMVGSYVQLLARRYRGQLDQDADDFIWFAVDGVERMQRLLDGLLAYSRVRTQGGEFCEVDMNQVFDETIINLEKIIEESSAKVTRASLPVVTGDASQLGRVFQNLIANGIKFRRADAPEIHISGARDGHEWIFSVRDNGIGIDPQFSEKIFEIFRRLQARADYPGEGLGLSITKRIIDRHEGRIWVESEPGKGATFFFTIPDSGEPR